MDHPTETLHDRLITTGTGLQPWLWLPLLRLLAQGEPVEVADLAAAGRGEEDIRRALEALPEVEYDANRRIVGLGLTQRPTPHRFEVDGEQLYTWCALDTLIFPTLLGTTARIESSYRGTGTPVRLRVGPDGVSNVEPATAVVSLVDPAEMSSVRAVFCNHVHFFATPEEAGPWLARHREGEVIPVAEAWALASAMAGKIAEEGPRPTGTTAIGCNC